MRKTIAICAMVVGIGACAPIPHQYPDEGNTDTSVVCDLWGPADAYNATGVHITQTGYAEANEIIASNPHIIAECFVTE